MSEDTKIFDPSELSKDPNLNIDTSPGPKEYVVTCKDFDDLDSLYDDMETPGGNLYIPDRVVDLVHRRSISRNTHYMLTDEEAELVRQDARVIACELAPRLRGLKAVPFWEQTGRFSKNDNHTYTNTSKNWGLYRIITGNTVANWGTDGTEDIDIQEPIRTTSSGRNVDVVIVDAHINPDHPEFAVFPDGTGGSRVNQFNWFQYSADLGNETPETYTYSAIGWVGPGGNSNHGTHVAGTVAGNTQGWARNANIYNMAFQDALSGVDDWSTLLWDYLRTFHLTKPINPNTGRRNPTITNHSWGFSLFAGGWWIGNLNSVTYRGQTVLRTSYGTELLWRNALRGRGVPVWATNGTNWFIVAQPGRDAATEADIQDAINDGVIIISAAGNSRWCCSSDGDDDFDNAYLLSNGVSLNHSRGSTPAAADNVICVGSIGSLQNESKSNFSNWGPRVDIWAPGSDIISCVFDDTADTEFGITTLEDPRDADFRIGSIDGTSMASPQVCGVIACLAETEQNLTQAEALDYLVKSSLDEVGDLGGNPNLNNTNFGNSNNRYLFMKRKRSISGSLQKTTYKNRNSDTSGVKYPRTNNSVTKRK